MSARINNLVVEGEIPSCFISRAWPTEEKNMYLTRFMDLFNRKLLHLGIKTFYDTNRERGLHSSIHGFMNEIGNAAMVLILLTPDYRKNSINRTYVLEEIVRIKEKNVRRRFILLSGTPQTSTPEEFMSLPEKLYYDATDGKGNPNLNKLLNCICDLIDTRRWNLIFRKISKEAQMQIESYIDAFKNFETLPFIQEKEGIKEQTQVQHVVSQQTSEEQFQNGILFIKDENCIEAVKWFVKAANQGDEEAQSKLEVLKKRSNSTSQ